LGLIPLSQHRNFRLRYWKKRSWRDQECELGESASFDRSGHTSAGVALEATVDIKQGMDPKLANGFKRGRSSRTSQSSWNYSGWGSNGHQLEALRRKLVRL